MRLLYAPASPYSAKVRMAAKHAGLPLEAETVDTNNPPDSFLTANPLGKIPVLLLDGGEAVFDSRVILRHLDRLSGGKLFPRDPAALLAAEKREALADGVCDALLAHVYERRTRPEEKVHQPWLDRQWGKAVRTLAVLDGALPPLDAADAGTIALRAMAGYLALRFGGQWEADAPGLVEWAAAFGTRHPELASLTVR